MVEKREINWYKQVAKYRVIKSILVFYMRFWLDFCGAHKLLLTSL